MLTKITKLLLLLTIILSFTQLVFVNTAKATYTLQSIEYKTVKTSKTSSGKIEVSFKAIKNANRYKIHLSSGKDYEDEYIWYYDTTDSTSTNTRKYTLNDESISQIGGIQQGDLKFLSITPLLKKKGETTKSGKATIVPFELPFDINTYTSSLKVGSWNVYYYPYSDYKNRSYSSRARAIGKAIKTQSLDIVGMQESYWQYGYTFPTKTIADNANLSRSVKYLGKQRVWQRVTKKEFKNASKKGEGYYLKKFRKIKTIKKKGKKVKAYYLKKEKSKTKRCSGTSNQILYKRSKFLLQDCGQITLDNPNEGDGHTRYVQYSKFKVRKTGKTFFVFNTHLTTTTQTLSDKRIKEARKINSYIKKIAKQSQYILTGDLNTSYANSFETAASTLNNYERTQDLELTSTSKSKIEYKTYNAFNPNLEKNGSKIDKIFVSNNVIPMRFKLIYKTPNITPSDHQLIYGEVGL